MKNTTHTAGVFPSTLRFRLQAYLLAAAATVAFLLTTVSSSFAGSATWKTSPATGDWNTASNWTPSTVPNGLADTATFGTSNTTSVTVLRQPTQDTTTYLDGIVFATGASAFTIRENDSTLSISGAGITNNSGITQNFVNTGGSNLRFAGSATAGSLTAYNNQYTAGAGNSSLYFSDNATAGSATITNTSVITFQGSSTAANATIINNPNYQNPGGYPGGDITFAETSTAGNSTLIVNAGTSLDFQGDSTAGEANIVFATPDTGYSGILSIYSHNPPGVSIGSIEGRPIVSLGDRNLTVGSNNRSTVFSGIIQSNTGGSLTKVGTGKLTLKTKNTYKGGTTINGGTLLVKNGGDSATGAGPVQVNAGTLRGTGKIGAFKPIGGVTVGNGSSSGAVLVGGESVNAPGTLTIKNPLTFNALSTYKSVLKRSTPKASNVSAVGVTINSTAQFIFVDPGTGALPAGTVFTVLDNTSTSPISGRFSNLAQGLIFTSKGTSFKVSYTGGTGNDLTLTVQ